MAASTIPAWRAPRCFMHRISAPDARPQGASTITQQVAKNFFFSNEVSFARKIKEALLAMRLERTYSKDKILELYLNEIYLGFGAYGIAAASLVYFDKSVNDLTVARPPSSPHCRRRRERCIRFATTTAPSSGAITWSIACWKTAGSSRPTPTSRARIRWSSPIAATTRIPSPANISPRKSRRDILERYGEKKLYEGGLSVRTHARSETAGDGAQNHGGGARQFRRGAGLARRDEQARYNRRLGRQACRPSNRCRTFHPWRMAVVLETSDQSARIGFPAEPGNRWCRIEGPANRPHHAGWREMGTAGGGTSQGQDSDGCVRKVLSPGDIIYADPLIGKDGSLVDGQYRLRQLPEISGAMVVMDPHTGRVQAMVGGFSFDQSQFNRANRPIASRARPSSRSSIPRRSTTAIRRHRLRSMVH